MRTTKEVKAEVMRRSKKRIAHRRRLMTAVACCVVLAVSATVGTAIWSDPPELLSGYYAGGTQEGEDIGSALPNYGGNTEGCEDGSQTWAVTVSDGETVTRYTDEKTMSAILSAIDSAKSSTEPLDMEYGDGNKNGSPHDGAWIPELQTESVVITAQPSLTITVGDRWYYLVPNRLMDVTARQYYELSDEMYDRLLTAVGK